jgi:uncharacterized membrane protein
VEGALAENFLHAGQVACSVLVEDSAEALASSYVQVGDLVRVGDGRGVPLENSAKGWFFVMKTPCCVVT